MRMEQMYQEVILDHYRNPHARGLRDPHDSEVHHVNPTCGDEVTLRVHLSDDLHTITDISYDGQGCSISQASTSIMTEQLIGVSVEEALRRFDAFDQMITSRGTDDGDEDLIGDGIALAGISRYPARVKCALLGWMAFKDALSQAVDARASGASADGAESSGSEKSSGTLSSGMLSSGTLSHASSTPPVSYGSSSPGGTTESSVSSQVSV